ncbi:hypothetical protein [Endozoicomonas sp. SCSIO W0465]|uniref:hypothetical protein n=1 Tax=Endozoicomonas sp. SCSIO W0465 TaxID=2918516 RepID=UPI0020765B49|nr:hypothetical protein [Endozoicomonas sp. SCSIO W0465]USE38114.1 hypothetical protein MJO57_08070 [Endozoicomonas sp. SCSIO W0465]
MGFEWNHKGHKEYKEEIAFSLFEVVTSTKLVARLDSEVLSRLYATEAIDVFFGRLSKLAWFHN